MPDPAADPSGWNVEESPFDKYREVDFPDEPVGLERIPSEHYVKCFVQGAVETFEGVRPRSKPDADIERGCPAARGSRHHDFSLAWTRSEKLLSFLTIRRTLTVEDAGSGSDLSGMLEAAVNS